MSSKLYTGFSCIFLLPQAREFQCDEDRAAEPERIGRISASVLRWFLLSTAQREYFVLIRGFIGKAILSFVPFCRTLTGGMFFAETQKFFYYWHIVGPVTLITMIMFDFTIFHVKSLLKKKKD